MVQISIKKITTRKNRHFAHILCFSMIPDAKGRPQGDILIYSAAA